MHFRKQLIGKKSDIKLQIDQFNFADIKYKIDVLYYTVL